MNSARVAALACGSEGFGFSPVFPFELLTPGRSSRIARALTTAPSHQGDLELQCWTAAERVRRHRAGIEWAADGVGKPQPATTHLDRPWTRAGEARGGPGSPPRLPAPTMLALNSVISGAEF